MNNKQMESDMVKLSIYKNMKFLSVLGFSGMSYLHKDALPTRTSISANQVTRNL